MSSSLYCFLVACAVIASNEIYEAVIDKLNKIKHVNKLQDNVILFGVFLPLFSLVSVARYPRGMYVMTRSEFIVIITLIIVLWLFIFACEMILDRRGENSEKNRFS